RPRRRPGRRARTGAGDVSEIDFPEPTVAPLTDAELALLRDNERDERAAPNENRQLRRLTDDGNAYRLVDKHGTDLRYLPGDGWYAWDGTRWLHDSSGETVRRARDLVRRLHAEADRAAGDDNADEKIVKALRQH